MQTIHGRQHIKARQQKSGKSAWKRRALWIAGALLVLLVVANLVVWAMYRGRVLPNVSLGPVRVGNIAYSELDDKVEVSKLLVDEVELTAEGQRERIPSTALGVAVDWPATQENLKRQRSFFPLANLFAHRTVPVQLKVDDAAFAAEQARLAEVFHKNTLAERVVFSGQNFEIAPPEAGYQLDQTLFKEQVLAGIREGKQGIAVPTQIIPANEITGGVQEALAALRKKLQVTVMLQLNGTMIRPATADIGAWFVQDGSTMVFSADKAKAYVGGLGSVYNTGNAAAAIGRALDKQLNIVFVLSPTQAPAKYTYCTATKGVSSSHLPEFIAKTATVLGDTRGWSAGGKVGFERVESGCDFSLWLSAPSQMTSFGGLCDDYYSCRSGRNVVINFDRWQGATDPWNAAGGSLEDYRVMVTNHEVGHWLGFAHRNCPGPGQPAPVMQQQSIGLQGCTFNPWPTEPELSSLKQARGIAMLPAREDFAIVAAGAPCSCGHCIG